MKTRSIVVTNPQGLHARPASLFVKEAKKFKSDVRFRFHGGEYNAKSIITVLRACVAVNSELELVADGEDEDAALEGIANIVVSGLGE